jgi:hypothetical protein
LTGIDGYDWGSVGWSNPVPGDPDVVRHIGGQISDLASESSLQNQLLQSVGDAASTIWSGPAANAFHPTMKKLPGQLDQLINSYNDAAYAINGFWPKHKAAQQLAVQALAKAQAAQAAISAAQTQVSSSQSAAQSAAGSYNQSVNPPPGTPPPATAAAKAANLTRTTNLAMAYRTAQTQLGNAQSSLNSARGDMSAAVSMRDQATSDFSTAAGMFVGLMKAASKAGIQNVHHGWLSSIGSAIAGGVSSAFHAGENLYHDTVHLTDEGLGQLGKLAVNFGDYELGQVEAGWHDFTHAMATALPVLKVIDTVLSDASLVVGVLALVVAPIPGLDAVVDPALEGLNEVLMVAKTGDDLLELAGGDEKAKTELVGDAIGIATLGIAGGLEADGATDAEKVAEGTEETAAHGASGATARGSSEATDTADTAPTGGSGSAGGSDAGGSDAGGSDAGGSSGDAAAPGATGGSGATDDEAAGATGGGSGTGADDGEGAAPTGGGGTGDDDGDGGEAPGSDGSPSTSASDPATASDPASASDPAPSEPPSATDPAPTSDPATSEPATSEPPSASDPAPSEPPSATEPATTEPAAAQPSDTSASEPPAPSDPPSASQPSASEPSASQPSASEPSASEPSASQPSASEPPASEPSAGQSSGPSAHEPPSASEPSAPSDPAAGDRPAEPSTSESGAAQPQASSEPPAASAPPADGPSVSGHEPASDGSAPHDSAPTAGHEPSQDPSAGGHESTSAHGSSGEHPSPAVKQSTLSKVLGTRKIEATHDFRGMKAGITTAKDEIHKAGMDLPKTYVKWVKQAYHEDAGETVGADGKVTATAKDGLAPLRKLLYVRDHVEAVNDSVNFGDKMINGHGNFLQRQEDGKDWETQAWDKATGSDDEPPIWVTAHLDELGVG